MTFSFIATYRLQLNKDFTFDDCISICDYLRDLNISHLYLSPIMTSTEGSNHGYDTTDFAQIDVARGGTNGFQNLLEKICHYEYPLKIILDIVPNHMAANLSNPYWKDVLKKGENSEFWHLFDLKTHDGKQIRLPVLSSWDDYSKIKINKDDETLETPAGNFPLAQQTDFNSDLRNILQAQFYQLLPWTDSVEHMSYRRFFDVTSLIGIKAEEPENHSLTHRKLYELINAYPCIEGVRVDHVDGLAHPEEYLKILHQHVPSIWIEKILSREEVLDKEWKTNGTTGYEFIDRINQLFINPQSFSIIKSHWLVNAQSHWRDFENCVLDCKTEVISGLFQPELNRLVSFSETYFEDANQAKYFWVHFTSALSVYRIYQNKNNNETWLKSTLERAMEWKGKEFEQAAVRFIPALLDPCNHLEEKISTEWQQLSGPVMAKGLEDTAHYRFTPLTALNEVGCSPILSSNSKNHFIEWLSHRQAQWSLSMNTTSTHDTKRSEDARHRLYALNDKAELWIKFYEENKKLNSHSIPEQVVDLLYQSLIATWPIDGQPDDDYRKRIQLYMLKSSREAKQYTYWTHPNEDFENKLEIFISDVLSSQEFINSIETFMNIISPLGALNSLSVQTIKILSPGIPDLYQGSESWEFNLVDPDNRRNVDYSKRQELLFLCDNLEMEQGREALLNYLIRYWQNGAIKIWLTRKLLQIRQNEIPDPTGYTISLLETEGAYAENIIAYQLHYGQANNGLIILTPRYTGQLSFLSSPLLAEWKDTNIQLPANLQNRKFENLLTNFSHNFNLSAEIHPILKDFPIAVLKYHQT